VSFIVPFPPSGGKVTHSFLSIATSGFSTATTYTFAGMNFGTAFATRYIVACVMWSGGGGLSSCTIGGVSASIIANALNSTSCGMGVAAVPSGTSGTVVANITGGGNANGCVIGLYALNGINSPAASQIMQSTANPPAASLNPQPGSVVIACATGGHVGGCTPSWSGLTGDSQAAFGFSGNGEGGVASAEFVNAPGTFTATCNWLPGTALSAGCFAIFNPP